MTGSNPRALALLAAVGTVTALVLSRLLEATGQSGLPVPWTVVVVPVAAAVALVWFALPVRRWTRGDRTRALDPLRAARTVVLAKASSLVAALFLGWYLGVGLWVLRPSAPQLMVGRFGIALAAAAGFALMLAAGLIVERWCRQPPDADEPAQRQQPSAS